jgi:hypothetical protein
MFVTAALLALLAAREPDTGQSQALPTPQADVSCRFRHAVTDIASFDELPEPIVKLTLRRMRGTGNSTTSAEEIAPRGGLFDPDDVVDFNHPLPMRRFIRAGHDGDRWFLAYEHGGISYEKIVVVYAFNGHATPRVVAHYDYDGRWDPDLCQLTDRLLDGLPYRQDRKSDWW